MSFLLASAARATTGARSGQEDAFRLWPAEGVAQPEGENGGLLAVLADGMGGHTGGAVAGQTACSTFTEVFAAAEAPYDQRLQSALQASNEALAKGVEQNAALRGMGCTLVAAWMDTLGIRWTSVGDSLLLLYRFPDVIRLNADHSLGFFLDEQARQNRISASEAKQHANRNALRSALTGSKIDLIDLRDAPLELRPGDWILLASDGICSLEGDEIADIVYNYRQSTPEEMADGLIAAVVKKGVAGQDNTTVVAVRVDQAPEAGTDVTTRRVAVRKAGDEETELRSRRIGMTGRKTAPSGRARTPTRAAVWLVAAAVFFLFFAVTVLLRALQPAAPPIPAPEAATPAPPAAAAVPEPATPDTPDPSTQDTPRAPAPSTTQTPKPNGATAPDASQPPAVPVPPKAAPPAPQRATPVPTPQRVAPAQPPPAPSPAPGSWAPSEPQPAAPVPTPSTQSGEAPETRAARLEREQKSLERERRRRARREERAKEAGKEVPKEPVKTVPKSVLKDIPKSVPSEVPREAPRDVLPQGFGSD